MRAQPAHEIGPVGAAHEQHGEVADLAGLDEGECLEHLVERAEPAGEHHERRRVAHEHHLAREEVMELERQVHVAVDAELERQVDVEADRERARVARAAVGGLHDARPSAGDDREAGGPERSGGLACEGVLRVVAWRPGGAEDRHCRPHARQRPEALGQLAVHALSPGSVRLGRDDRLDLGAEQLLVESRRWARLARFARLVGHLVLVG